MLFRKKKPSDPMERVVKVRGGGRSLMDQPRAGIDDGVGPAVDGRNWRPRATVRRYVPASNGEGSGDGYDRGNFYRWLRDSVPIISTGVRTWVRLCATQLIRTIEASPAAQSAAVTAINALDGRLLEAPYGRGSGMGKLIEGAFLELFTVGRFAAEVILTDDGRGIDHIHYVNPYIVQWEHTARGWTPYRENERGDKLPFDPDLFFYAVLGMDLSDPAGAEPLACIPFVTEVEQLLLEDMARSSHNAGTPRLQIKIGRPERLTWESDKDYSERVNHYFNDTASQFNVLEPDENIFTWSDVEVTVVGGAGNSTTWRFNREQVIEDVVTGLRLFPWVLGRTHKTTQNWVQSQYNLLMQMVSTYQKSGVDLADWLVNIELRLKGVDALVTHHFHPHPDPFRKERADAEKTELENIDFKVTRGYISKDDGAREMGYVRADKAE